MIGERSFYSTPSYETGGTIAGAGSVLLQITGFNPSSERRWLQLFDAASPAPGASPLQSILVEPGANFSWVPGFPGYAFSTAMQWRVSDSGDELQASAEAFTVVAAYLDGLPVPTPPPPVYTTSVGANFAGAIFRTTDLAAGDFTRTFWGRYLTPTVFSPIWVRYNLDTSYYRLTMTDPAGPVHLDSLADNLEVLTPGDAWVFYALTVESSPAPGRLSVRWAYEGQTVLQGPISIDFPVAMAPDFESLLSSAIDTGNSSMANFRAWDAVLSVPELLAEYHSPTPVRTADIYTWLPLDTVSGVDQSDAGNDWTVGGAPVVIASAPLIS